jgi:dipeptidyl peptidase IV (DPP IV)-like protein/WD40 repeat protein
MPKVDDELTRRLRGAERPVDVEGLFEGLERRRARHEAFRKAQIGLLALVVVAATAGGFVALRRAFDGGRSTGDETPAPILPANGEIVFSAEGNDGYTHLYAVQPDGSGRRQITDFGTNDTDPSVSPDGRTIAFVHQLEDVNPTIASIPIGGGTVTWLMDPEFEGSGPAWSPDGSEVLVVGDGSGLYSVSANGSDRRTVISVTKSELADPSWSPDGSRIVFATRDGTLHAGTPWSLITVTPDGKQFIGAVHGSNEDARAPAWSPDGSLIAFLAPHEAGVGVWTIPAAGGEPSLIATVARLEDDLTWAPDGSSLLASDGDWIYRVMARPAGDPAENLVRVVRGSSAAWQPIPSTPLPSPEPEPEPSASPGPEPEVAEIGLPFRLCHVSRLDGVDFLGDGAAGIAWVGMRARENGSCPPQGGGSRAVVAADFNGDELADSWWDGIEYCLYCEPYDATDLDADGDEELVVLESHSSTPSFLVFTTRPDIEGQPLLQPVVIAAPGHEAARLIAGDPLRISTGGDEGFSGWVRCDGFPDAPVLVVTWRDHPIEGNTMEVHQTKLVLQADGAAHITDTNDYTAPVGTPIPGTSDAPACGVDWQI